MKVRSKYSGWWRDGSINGFGRYDYKDGRYYEGDFKNSLYHGKGIHYMSDGSKYEGNWRNN